MSARAACRLETLGFQQVDDYVAGKADWLAHALPTQGALADQPTAGSIARHDVALARLSDRAGEVGERIAASPYRVALVVQDGVLVGRVRRSALGADPTVPVDVLLDPGPLTVRPHTTLGELAARLRPHDLRSAIVTTPEGRLLGMVRREDLEELLA